MIGFILALIIGGVAGVIAARLMNSDFGMVLNVALGIGGAFVFNIVFGILFGIGGGNLLWQLIAGVVGACALIWGYRQYKNRS